MNSPLAQHQGIVTTARVTYVSSKLTASLFAYEVPKVDRNRISPGSVLPTGHGGKLFTQQHTRQLLPVSCHARRRCSCCEADYCRRFRLDRYRTMHVRLVNFVYETRVYEDGVLPGLYFALR